MFVMSRDPALTCAAADHRMEPPPSAAKTDGQPPKEPSPAVQTLATKAVVAYSGFLTAVVAATAAAPAADDSVGASVGKFEAAMTELREGVASKRRKVAAAPAQEPEAAASGRSAAAKQQQKEQLARALGALSSIADELAK
jgi:hypothetical protein